jgi:hypothetical protein
MVELPWDAASVPDAHVEPDPGPADLLVAGPDGPHVLGPATVDSDADGRVDTAVVPGPDALALGTDLDGDADVDVLTLVHRDGTSTTTGTGDEPPGPPVPGWDEGPAPPAPTIDPVTGRWMRGG